MKELKTFDEYQDFLLGHELVAINFTATWSPPCKMIGPKFEAMAQEFPHIAMIKIDVDVDSETAQKCGIQAMPTFQFYKDGNKVDELDGASETRLREKLRNLK